MSTQPIVAPSKTDDFMPLHGIDHVEFYVGNALQAASYWVRALGFKEVGLRRAGDRRARPRLARPRAGPDPDRADRRARARATRSAPTSPRTATA